MAKLQVAVQRPAVGGHGLTFPYDERMVRAIKSRVPAERRAFDAATKTWWLERASDLAELRWSTNGWAEFHKKG